MSQENSNIQQLDIEKLMQLKVLETEEVGKYDSTMLLIHFVATISCYGMFLLMGICLIVEMNVGCLEMQYKETFC